MVHCTQYASHSSFLLFILFFNLFVLTINHRLIRLQSERTWTCTQKTNEISLSSRTLLLAPSFISFFLALFFIIIYIHNYILFDAVLLVSVGATMVGSINLTTSLGEVHKKYVSSNTIWLPTPTSLILLILSILSILSILDSRSSILIPQH